jgi:hypothetical protein
VVELRGHPLFELAFPGDTADRAARLFGDRHALLEALDRLPQTLVHHDASHRNLLARTGPAGRSETVAIDWAFTGTAAVGAEAAPLAFSDVLWGNGVGADDLPALEAHVFDGYMAGLHDAGWTGDPRLARLGYAASAALRFGPLLGFPTFVEAGAKQRQAIAETLGHPYEQLLERYSHMLPLILERAEEAHRLVAAIS